MAASEGSVTPPRVWGKLFCYSINATIGGTPPRVWGKLIYLFGHFTIGTPPRVWENVSFDGADCGVQYTPTCVGKTRPVGNVFHQLHRYTPTCVGKTFIFVAWTSAVAGTPPRGGENDAMLKVLWPTFGTPPRVWGKPTLANYFRSLLGTPPRVWGKLHRHGPQLAASSGPPPRVWGKRLSIPVYYYLQVHPHVCGENYVSGLCDGRTRPVHPHVCGENSAVTSGVHACRSTPTCVGKTCTA